CLLAAATYYPIYLGMSYFSNPVNFAALILLVLVQVVYVTMVYGPIAAFLVELFPARIRYTSLSLPYHLGNGWFGGFTPVTILAINLATGNIYAGLIYPIAVALLTWSRNALPQRDPRHKHLERSRGQGPCRIPVGQHSISSSENSFAPIARFTPILPICITLQRVATLGALDPFLQSLSPCLLLGSHYWPIVRGSVR